MKHNLPAVPLQIPSSKREPTRSHKRHARRPPRPRDASNAVPPSVHALLASTTIPRQKSTRSSHSSHSSKDRRRLREKDDDLALDAVLKRQQDSEKALSLSLSRSPLDVLLSSPEDLDDDDDSTSFSGSFLSLASTRTISIESMPSLATCSSPLGTSSEDPASSPPLRRRRTSSQFVSRRSLEPVSPGVEAHPLSAEVKIDELDFRVFQPPAEEEDASGWDAFSAALPLRSAFKSNLTASLRMLRSAAKSFSNISLSSIPAEDFLTRSILTLDPGVPFTDERRPPVLEEEPSAALRRYLNPTTRPRVEETSGRPARQFAASIQMQTYKVEKLRENARAARLPAPVTPRTPAPGATGKRVVAAPVPAPGMRQREVRENPDFIRIAVLEMAMRRRGKLDDQRPGRARWALPARKAVTKVYEVGEDGVPLRWIPMEG